MREIAIVALDLNISDVHYQSFAALSAQEKLNRFEQRIKDICDDLKTKEPNSVWLITWREYGITQDEDNRTVSSDMKQLFKQTMQKLANQYQPNLIIAAGTISAQKPASDISKIEKIKQYYAEHGWIKDAESSLNKDQQNISEEEEKIDHVLQGHKPLDKINITRNSCYIFHRNEIWRHDKIAPIKEHDIDAEDHIFQPGKGRNLNAFCELSDDYFISPITIGVEICREHDFAILKKQSLQNKPLLHLVMSHTISLDLDAMHGDYLLQLDSLYKPRLILSKDENAEQLPIRIYQTNMTVPKYHLMGPLEPVYPFEKKVMDKIATLIKLFPSGKHQSFLQQLHNEILSKVRSMDGHGSDVTCAYLDLKLNELESQLKNDLQLDCSSPFKNRDHKKTIHELRQIIQEERQRAVDTSYLTRKDALPLKNIDKFDYFIREGYYSAALSCLDDTVLAKRSLSIESVSNLIRVVEESNLSSSEKENYHKKIFENAKSILMDRQELFDGRTLLHGLCEADWFSVIKTLMPYCKDKINQIDSEGNTALHHAIICNPNPNIIEYLIENGADISITNQDGETPLTLAQSLPEIQTILERYKMKPKIM